MMEALKIQYELKKRRITQREIARDLDVTEGAVSFVIHRKGVSHRIMKAISRALGEDVKLIFPEHYYRKRKHRKAA